MSLLDSDPIYKPFRYPWAYDAWLTQQRIHWLPEEVPLADDVTDWRNRLTAPERNLLTQIFRFFTQADVEVNNCYMQHYSRVFQPTEVKMMLAAFSNMETVHIAAYSHLLDTIGMPESEYQAFLKYKAMKDKYDYMGASAFRQLRDPAELPALQQDEGHGADRYLVGARRIAAYGFGDPPVSYLHRRKQGAVERRTSTRPCRCLLDHRRP
jgi:ribonucleoside-diphosphate reductase beta chain